MIDPDYGAWKQLVADLPLPAAIVDADAIAHNVKILLERLGPPPTTLRIATKSLRVAALVKMIDDLAGTRARGLMTFSARETSWLAEQHGFRDFIVAYPVARPDDAAALVRAGRIAGASVRVVVDDVRHIDLIASAVASEPAPGLSLCIDLDAAWRPLGAKLHLGVRRSPVRDAETAVALARYARDAGLVVDSVMAYEAQVAGLPDTARTSGWLDPVRRFIRTRSMPSVSARRRGALQALGAAGFDVEIVNGGGTGSVFQTAHDGTVTEVTAGSGFLCSHLFDGYRDLSLRPAAFFVLPIVRVPDPGFVTAFSGGFIASGPPAADRQPLVHAPRGLAPLSGEGWGEVQTPFAAGPEAPPLAIGDPIIARHAKAGELFERFDICHIARGGRIVAAVPTYRGESRSFG